MNKMNDEAFARLVAEDVKNNSTDQQKQYLALPENIVRWQLALKFLAKNLEEQIQGINEYENNKLLDYQKLGDEGIRLIAETSANFNSRRAKIERFKFFVSQKLDEVARLSGSANKTPSPNMADFYFRAITKWLSLMEEYELEPTRIDEALIASLDGKWEFDEITKDNINIFFDE